MVIGFLIVLDITYFVFLVYAFLLKFLVPHFI